MKHAVFFLLCIYLFATVSCSYEPEEMVEDYNKKFNTTTSAAATTEEPGKEYELPTLLKYTTYYVEPTKQLDFTEENNNAVNSGYVEYVWTLTGADGTSYNMESVSWTAHINTNALRMAEGTYTLKLRVKNRLGIFYYDTAKVIVGDY